MNRPVRQLSLIVASAFLAFHIVARSQEAKPVFVDGQAQVVEAFFDRQQWVRESLWVETEFDSDQDGRLDRMFVDVTRQRQTETEGLKVPAIYFFFK